LWGDDRQVVELQVTKRYGEADSIRITIEQAMAAPGRGCAARAGSEATARLGSSDTRLPVGGVRRRRTAAN
jgi:hypothetical protein